MCTSESARTRFHLVCHVCRYLEIQCIAALRKMHCPKLALRDKLSSTDGVNAFQNQTQGHSDTIGCHASNDHLAESVFGTFDYVLRRFGGITQEAASAVSQAVRSKILSLGDHIKHRPTNSKAPEVASPPQEKASSVGWLHTLPPHEQEALVEVARLTVFEMREVDRADHKELDEYHKSRHKANEENELDALLTRYALALSFFDRWRSRGVKTMGEVTAALAKYDGGEDRTQVRVSVSWWTRVIVARAQRDCLAVGKTELAERADRDEIHRLELDRVHRTVVLFIQRGNRDSATACGTPACHSTGGGSASTHE